MVRDRQPYLSLKFAVAGGSRKRGGHIARRDTLPNDGNPSLLRTLQQSVHAGADLVRQKHEQLLVIELCLEHSAGGNSTATPSMPSPVREVVADLHLVLARPGRGGTV